MEFFANEGKNVEIEVNGKTYLRHAIKTRFVKQGENYIDIFKLKYNKIKKLYSILFSRENKNIYISNGVVYIPYKGGVLGLSLVVLEYCGIKTEKVLQRIKSNPNNNVFEDDNKFVFKLTKRLGNKKYAVPYFISS